MFYLILTVIALIFLWDCNNKRKIYELTAKIPGPMPIPIIGTWRIFNIRSTRDIEKEFVYHHKKYGSLLRVFLFHRFALLVARPDVLETILGSTKYIKKAFLYDLVRPWLGQGLLLSSGKLWHDRRKILTPAFHFNILEQFVDVFDQQSKIFVEKLKIHFNTGKAFNVHPYVGRLTVDILCEAAMGVKMNSQNDPGCKYVNAVQDATDIFMKRISYHYLTFDPIFKLLAPKMKLRQDEVLKTMHDFTERIIIERSEQLKKDLKHRNLDNNSKEEEELGIKRKKRPLLDILLQSSIDGKPLSNQNIREEVDNFLFAGHDTTTAALSFTLCLISRHPHVQHKMLDEIHKVCGDPNEEPLTYNKLLELKYIECVIKESLRFCPPVPVIGRELIEDLHIDGQTIPIGTQVLVNIFVMMRNPDLFPNPELFNPDRHFIDDSKTKANAYTYIPFGAGPRNCIGQRFAMLEMKTVLCHVLRNYELIPLGEEPQVLISLVTTSENGIHIGIRERKF